MNTNHTPAPYRIDRDPANPDSPLLIIGGEVTHSELLCEIPAQIGEKEQANAQFILSAITHHSALLAALEECVTEDGAACLAQSMNAATNLRKRIAAINSIARAVIAQATGSGGELGSGGKGETR